MSSRREQVEELLDSLDVEVDVDLDQQLDQGGDMIGEASDLPGFVEVSSTSISTVEGFHPEEGSPDDFSKEFLLEDGSRVSIQVKRRPECPSCGYIFNEEDDPVNPDFPSCTECGCLVCRNCRNVCEACGTPLCNSCTMGHGVKDETYCPICRTDVAQELEHSRELEKQEQQHKQEMDVKELKLKAQKQLKELKLKAQNDRFSNRVEARQLQKQFLETVEKLKLKKRKQDLEMRKDRFNQIEAAADNIRNGGPNL